MLQIENGENWSAETFVKCLNLSSEDIKALGSVKVKRSYSSGIAPEEITITNIVSLLSAVVMFR